MCGIIGIITAPEKVFPIEHLEDGLRLLQHRGTESYGYGYVMDTGETKIIHRKGKIPSPSPSPSPRILSRGLGHTRYSTSGPIAQPFSSESFMLVHNGNIPDHIDLAQKLELYQDLVTNNDTELLVRYIERGLSSMLMPEVLSNLVSDVQGAYSFLVLTSEGIYSVRDRYGIRPLCVGQLGKGAWCYASETICFGDAIATDVPPGSVTICNGTEHSVISTHPSSASKPCIFEEIYFKNHKSRNVYQHRHDMGYQLGIQETNIIEDAIVVCLPNTAIAYAEGFSHATRLPFKKEWLIKANSDRTFILPTNAMRIEACNKAFMINKALRGRVIYLIDDSIVRGNTMRAILPQLPCQRIHVRICSPPVKNSCKYGIDIPDAADLIAHNLTTTEICEELGPCATSLRYLSIGETLAICTGGSGSSGCTHCFGTELLW
jgi:amidophosphoribosyltransferase